MAVTAPPKVNPTCRVGNRGACLALTSPPKPAQVHVVRRRGKEVGQEVESHLKGFRQRTEKMI